MMVPKRSVLILILLTGISLRCSSEASGSSAAASAQHKVDHIKANGALAEPDQTPTVFTEQEINAYIASGKIQLPEGVQSVHLAGLNGVITGTARVNFDKVRAGRKSSNPLLGMFSGTHDVEVEAHAHGSNRTGTIHVDSLALDGVAIPDFLLELFIEKYVHPRYPEVGVDTRVALPDKIDTATIGRHTLTITQK